MSFHPFHIVDQSPWPLLRRIRGFLITTGLIQILHLNNYNLLLLRIFIISLNILQWWRDISREARLQGNHTTSVLRGLKLGIVLFIIREVIFFFSFFWSYFHARLAPDLNIGIIWPPIGITAFNPYQTPLLNTIILLSSGISITWSHLSIINKNFKKRKISLYITILLGLYFSLLQGLEYIEAPFNLRDRIFGSTFFYFNRISRTSRYYWNYLFNS